MLIALIGSVAAPCASASAFEPRVPDGYFGMSAPELGAKWAYGEFDAARHHLSRIKAAGLDTIRSSITWRSVEPTAPTGGQHNYNWRVTDGFVAAAAQSGLRLAPTITTAPGWAANPLATAAGCGQASAPSVLSIGEYASFTAAVLRRYGRGGTFWEAHQSLPYLPVTRFEIWNEPNWRSFWCPGIDPATYARMAGLAADAAHAVDPEVIATLGGLAALRSSIGDALDPYGLGLGDFLDLASRAEPNLGSKIDAVAVHLYYPDPDVYLSMLGWAREQMRASGLGDAAMVVSEYGWRTAGAADTVSEQEREYLYRTVTDKLARTDCGVIGVFAHNWVTPENSPQNPEGWWGIANPETGELYPSGGAYRDAVALLEGRGPTAPPEGTYSVCDGSGEGRHADPEPDPSFPPRVDRSFFGISITGLPSGSAARRTHFDSIRNARIGAVRDTIDWAHLQPDGPTPTAAPQVYEADELTVQLASRGIGLLPRLGHPPAWALESEDWHRAYADALAVYARRLGRGGSFWAENGHLDRSLAPGRYEVAPVGNSAAEWWKGTASPAEYADLYVRARAALHEVDPDANALLSLYSVGDLGAADDFVRAMVAARPALAGAIDGVVISIDSPSQQKIENAVTSMRSVLEATGNDSASIDLVFGWPTSGSGAVSEEERAELYAAAAERLARTDCGIRGIYPRSWRTPESNAASKWDWYGMADPQTGALDVSGESYAAAIRLLRGYGDEAPPSERLYLCGAPPEPTVDPDPPPPPDDISPDPDPPPATPPAVRIEGGMIRRAKARFAIEVDGAAPIDELRCRLDRRRWASCSSPHTIRRLKPGRHKLTVRATDTSGNRGKARERWRVAR